MKIVELNQSNTILNRYLAEIRDIHIQSAVTCLIIHWKYSLRLPWLPKTYLLSSL